MVLELKADYRVADMMGCSFISSLDAKRGWFEALQGYFEQGSAADLLQALQQPRGEDLLSLAQQADLHA